MLTPEDVALDYRNRREGVLKALVTDQDVFYETCDPEKENLCLYGNSDGSWEVALPAEEVPPEMPEPSLGINFARNGMQRKDWLALVAVHSDTWLLAVAFYNGARLGKDGRERLFEMINELPTCFEVVSGRARMEKRNVVPPPSKRTQLSSARPAGPSAKVYRPNPRHGVDDDDDEEEDDDEGPGGDYADGEGDPCPNCGRVYRQGDFWIACDYCDTWYDGKCVQSGSWAGGGSMGTSSNFEMTSLTSALTPDSLADDASQGSTDGQVEMSAVYWRIVSMFYNGD